MNEIIERPVIFRNEKVGNLWGVLSIPKKGRKVPAVILVHGFNGTKSQRKFVKMGRVFAQNGIAVLRFDFSGCGDSEREFVNWNIHQWVAELGDAFELLKRTPRIDKTRIGLLGHSLGALIVCLLENQNGASILFPAKTLVLVAPALDQKNLIKIWYTAGERRKWRRQGYLDMPKFRIGVQYLNQAKDYTQIASAIESPTMVIHGSKDEDVPLEFSERVFRALDGEAVFQIIKGADHDFESYQASKQLISLSLKRFKNYL